MTDTQGESTVHRHHGGSIDFDSYRTRAAALRGQARRDGRSLRATGAGALVMAGAIGFALVISSTPTLGDRLAAVVTGTTQTR